jgi:putative flippase GtrA
VKANLDSIFQQIAFPFASTMIEQLIRFCIVGGSGVVVDFSVTYLFKEVVRLNKYIANSLGFITAATSNYILNRLWTFRSDDPQIMQQYFIFVVIAIVGLVINNGVIYLLHGRRKFNFYLAKIFAIGVVTLWNFFMNYYFNF